MARVRATARGRRWLGLMITALLSVGTAATATARPAPAHFDSDVSADNVYGGDEPWVAVNPKNHNNIVEYYQAGYADANIAGGRSSPTTAPPSEYDLVDHPGVGVGQYSLGHCTLGVSFNGGRTWRHVDPPVYDPLYSGCGDPTVAALPDGTFVILHVAIGPAARDVLRTARSYDGGLTWTSVNTPYSKIQSVANLTKGEVLSVYGFPDNDRPWLAVDASDARTYATFVAHEDPNGVSTNYGRRYVMSSMSGDQWDGPFAIDSADYPSQGTGTITATHGVLAVTYTAAAAPGRTCPCGVFETSTDHGRTWHRQVLPTAIAAAGGFVSGPTIAGDPARPGHYVIGGVNAKGTAFDVASTRDGGRHWVASAIHGHNGSQMNRAWLAFSPHKGIVGVFWREFNANGGQDDYAAVSTTNGASFSRPQKLNSQTAPKRQSSVIVFDDVSYVTLTDTDLYASWADLRGPAGNTITQAWLGRWHFAGAASRS